METSDEGSEALSRAQSILKNYFEEGAETRKEEEKEESSKQELSLTQLSRDDLASLTKEQLIELLTQTNTLQTPEPNKKTKDLALPSRPRSRSKKREASAPHFDKKTSIGSSNHHPSDSQSEQPSEKRNKHVSLHQLPEQEERETPKSEPESDSDHQRIRMQTMNKNPILDISLMSSIDASDVIHPDINVDQAAQMEDISALERSLEEPDGDSEPETVKTPKIEEEKPRLATTKQRSFSDNHLIEEKVTHNQQNKVDKSESKHAYKRFLRRRKVRRAEKQASEKQKVTKTDKSEPKKGKKRKGKKDSAISRSKSDTITPACEKDINVARISTLAEDSADSFAEKEELNDSLSEHDFGPITYLKRMANEYIPSPASSEVEYASAEYPEEDSKRPASTSLSAALLSPVGKETIETGSDGCMEQDMNNDTSVVPVESSNSPSESRVLEPPIVTELPPSMDTLPHTNESFLPKIEKKKVSAPSSKESSEKQTKEETDKQEKVKKERSVSLEGASEQLTVIPVEEEDETDDSYDIENEVSSYDVFDKKSSQDKGVPPKRASITIQKLLSTFEESGTLEVKKESSESIDDPNVEETFEKREGEKDDPRRYVKLGGSAMPMKRKFVGKIIESEEGRRIKENLRAQKLRRYISVGSGINHSALLKESRGAQLLSPVSLSTAEIEKSA